MTTNPTARRLRREAAAYAALVWPTVTYRPPTRDEVDTMSIRADGYSNAHVEGEHEANGICSFSGNMAARDCGEAMAASEYVECTDMTPIPGRTHVHTDCQHPATKSARAACRRARQGIA